MGDASSDKFFIMCATPTAGVTTGCDIDAMEQLEMVRGTVVAVLLQTEAGDRATGVGGSCVAVASSSAAAAESTLLAASQRSKRS